ncbi:hypothetical protein LTR46_003065 [Exophiala xenobiotica]|nr:hypothetical protein LTR46_003065 [Exophiala xenobiotica]
MQLSAAKVAVILAFISAQAGAIPAPSPQTTAVAPQASHSHGAWQGHHGQHGGAGGMAQGHNGQHGGPGGNGAGSHFRGNHGPSPDEEYDEVLERRDNSDDKFRGQHHGQNPAYTGHARTNGQYQHQRGQHGPMPDEQEEGEDYPGEGEEDSHLERRHNYITQPMANWKWWQTQGKKGGIQIKAGNPNVYPIDMKDDPIMMRLQGKRDAAEDHDEEEEDAEEQMEKRGIQWIRPKGPEQVDLTYLGGFRDHKTPKQGN